MWIKSHRRKKQRRQMYKRYVGVLGGPQFFTWPTDFKFIYRVKGISVSCDHECVVLPFVSVSE